MRIEGDGRLSVEYLTENDILRTVSRDTQERRELFDLIKSLLLRTPEIRITGKKVMDHDFMKRAIITKVRQQKNSRREVSVVKPEAKMLLVGTGIARPPV